VYVVEFWATWCGPCKESIPHLTELQAKYKDKATLVGVSVWERDDTAVEPFVKQWTGKMEYTVGTDDLPALPEDVRNNTRDAQIYRVQNGRMSQAWLKAAGRDSIPTAFVINQEGLVAWVGDPRQGLDDALEQVVAGTWDMKKATARHTAQLDVQGMRALQQAFTATHKDPAYLADAEKVGIEVSPISGADIRKLIDQIAKTPGDQLKRIENLIAAGG